VETKVGSILCGIYYIFKGIVGPLAVLLFAVAGISWIVSRDEPAKRKQAEAAMIAIIVGVLLLLIVEPILITIWKSVTGATDVNIC